MIISLSRPVFTHNLIDYQTQGPKASYGQQLRFTFTKAYAIFKSIMDNELNMDLEIVVAREEDLFVARCTNYPSAVGRGATEEEAIEKLGKAIVRQTNKQLNKLIKLISRHIGRQKSPDDMPSRKILNINMPLMSFPKPGKASWTPQDLLRSGPLGRFPFAEMPPEEDIRHKILELIRQIPNMETPPEPFEQMVIVGMPFSKN